MVPAANQREAAITPAFLDSAWLPLLDLVYLSLLSLPLLSSFSLTLYILPSFFYTLYLFSPPFSSTPPSTMAAAQGYPLLCLENPLLGA